MVWARSLVQPPATAKIYAQLLRGKSQKVIAPTFAEKIIMLRLTNEPVLTQRDLANKAGMSQSKIKRLELGEQSPKLEDIVKLSRAFKITTVQLLDGVQNG